jgi:uncharacterized membrane protein
MATSTSVQHPERWAAAAVGGAALLFWGWRSTRGDARTRLGGARGTTVEESFAINRPVAELYNFWRQLERLPTVMPELSSVRIIDQRRSHWVARGPAGWRTDWYADIINDIPNELIAWRTTDDSSVASAGSVHFDEGPHGRGTVVRIKLQYDAPAGKMGAAFAWAFGDAPSQVIREGLRRFKQLMETGEIPTTKGQPRGAR